MIVKSKQPNVKGTVPRRSYRQFCSLARALDILGERWTLLVVRNLLLGPQRYKDLLDGLPGIGTNLLARRLKDLEQQGIVRRRQLPPPAGSTVYELAELGRGLEPAVIALSRWGLWTLQHPRPRNLFRPAWGMLAMRILFRPEAARGVRETYQWQIDEEVFHIRVDDGAAEVQQGPAPHPDLVFTCDSETFRGLAARTLSPEDALASGSLKFEGDVAALAHFREVFQPPD